MGREIERKYRITCLPRHYLRYGTRIIQGYLSFSPEVRVRIMGNRSYLTIKSSGTLVRDEYEYRIPMNDAKSLLTMCEKQIVKTRYRYKGFMIDVYHRSLQGLIVAEKELASKHEHTILPPRMIGFEVTRNTRYKNYNLCKQQKVPPLPKRYRIP
jgi:CYTH domain-containing protein